MTSLGPLALSLRPGNASRFDSLNNLAAVLFTQFKQLGRKEDLEQGIVYLREEFPLCPPRHRTTCLTTLASLISTRFSQLGNIEDLDEAINHHRDASSSRPFRSASLPQ